jgi:predicted porin
MAMSKIVGPTGGYRDVGVQLFDWFTDGRWEYAYALMLSQGNGISFNTDHPDNHDVTTRLQASYVLQGAGQKREDIIAYVWNQTGNRVYAGNDNKRVREGVGARYAHHGVRLAGEYIRARGMIYVAPTPQFNDIGAPAYEPIDYVALDSNNTAAGYYLDAGWRFVQDWEADVRYDVLNSAYDERRATTWTFGAQYFYSPKLRVVMNYEMRKVEVTNPDAQVTNAQKIQGTAATVIGDSVGNRISAQLTYIF